MIMAKIFPVVLMMVIGLVCRRKKIISEEGINGLKTLATSFMLPVLLFHTLATTSYSGNTFRIVAVMFLQLCLAFLLGMILKKLIPSMGRFLPFLVSGFEGGMLGYPLYTVLYGEEYLSNMATLDIANTVFVFTIFLAVLVSMVNGSFKTADMIGNVLHSPVFWGVFLGIWAGLSGAAPAFLSTLPGQIYIAAKDMLVSSVSAIILIVVGYGMNFESSLLRECGRAVLARFLIQGVLLVITMFLLKETLTTPEAKTALVLYSFLPTTFVVPVYAKNERDGAYLSTSISMYSVITIIVFILLTLV